LKSLVKERKNQFLDFNRLDSLTIIPSEMLFASTSGLDPHISQKAALLQVNRIVKARNFSSLQEQSLVQIVKDLTEKPQFSVLGEERVNILKLNLGLDEIDRSNTNKTKLSVNLHNNTVFGLEKK
jgi:K+-transporting ATPase ATPase C chain